MAYRVDIGVLQPPTRLANGTLRAEGFLTRSGVFKYRRDGRIVLEYRPPDEVFNADSLASFQLVPVTDDHPAGPVTAMNARGLTVGTTGENVRRVQDHVAAPVTITDAESISKAEAGKVQLSCGYTVDVIDEPGVTPEGLRYDSIQRNIRGNHVALVQVGRAGPSAALRMDSDGACMVTDEINPLEIDHMDELRKQLAAALAAQAQAEASATTATARADAAEARADAAEAVAKESADKQTAAEARADAADKQITDSARQTLESRALGVLGEDHSFKTDASDVDVMIAVVEKVQGEGSIPAKRRDDAVYVESRFDYAMDLAAQSKDAVGGMRQSADATGRSDAGDAATAEKTACDKQREASRKTYLDAWN